jgi:hypothetical protein
MNQERGRMESRIQNKIQTLGAIGHVFWPHKCHGRVVLFGFLS